MNEHSPIAPVPAPFAFNAANLEKAKNLIARYPAGRQASAVMGLLDLAQRQEGWVSRAAMDQIAAMLGMAPMRVYEVATFYSMYNLKPVGRNHIQVCTNISCMLRGSDDVLRACKETLGVDGGETTADGAFSVQEVECAGACVNGPVVQIGDDYYEDLDYQSTKGILDALKRGEAPKAGSQTGRQCSCPAGGPTTLKTLPVKGGA